MMKKIGTFCVSLLKGVPVAERRRHAQNTVTACVNPPKMESPNGAAKLRRGKQSSSLQGKHTNTEIDTEAQGITCTDINTICTNTLYKFKYLLTRWVMCSRNVA